MNGQPSQVAVTTGLGGQIIPESSKDMTSQEQKELVAQFKAEGFTVVTFQGKVARLEMATEQGLLNLRAKVIAHGEHLESRRQAASAMTSNFNVKRATRQDFNWVYFSVTREIQENEMLLDLLDNYIGQEACQVLLAA